MGCSSCGTSNGKPAGCKSNGGCSSGGCNRMNVHDWLANLPFHDPESACKIVEVTFNQGSRKEFYRNVTLQHFVKGDMVTVEGVSGFDVGTVNLTGELVRLQLKKKGVREDDPELKKILRRPSETDLQKLEENKKREPEALIRSRAIARQLGLEMKICEVEIQADGRKATFFYTADGRVDFRELIKVYASEFRVKVEMKQIGARQEAAKVGGIGSCGRELCCSTWLSDFKSVTTVAARYQNLSINQTKLSGQCGRLKCCLNYELDTYLDALQGFPEHAETLNTVKGLATLVKKDIFRNLMWYVLPDSNKQYPLTIERVREIRSMNQRGEAAQELKAVDVTSTKPVAGVEEHAFVDVVGQISLRSLEKNQRRQKQKQQQQQQPQQKKKTEASPNNGNRQDRGRGGQGPRPDRNEGPKREQRPGGGQRARGEGPQGQGGSARRENRDPRNNPEGRAGQENRENRSARPDRGPREPRDQRSARDQQEPREPRGPREGSQPGGAAEGNKPE